MIDGELLTRWSVRAAVALYLVGLLLRFGPRVRPARLPVARWAWTTAYALFLIHVVCAFQFVHHWSHRAAYEATARETLQVVSLNWGGGLYVNYLFTLVWGVDVLWWWSSPDCYRKRPAVVEWTVQLFLAFIVVNATIVFPMRLSP